MTKKCTGCGNDIHPKRLELVPKTTQCVECSTTGRKSGVTVTIGEGDHTFNDIIIIEPGEKLPILEDEDIKFDDEYFDEEEVNED